MKLEYFHAVDTGRMRQNNEDSVAVDELHGLAVLADGMGGYNAGEVASGMATSFVCNEMARWLGHAGGRVGETEIAQAMEICVDNANRAIFNASNSNPQYAGMGTTLVVAVFHGQQLCLGHVGDSRAYRLRSGRLEQITRDHSLLQEQIDAGVLTAEQAAYSANKNLVTRAVGVEDTVVLESHVHAVQPGDLLLMCSDGLSDMLEPTAMVRLMQATKDLPALGRSLIAAANEAGGRDNIAVILVRVPATPDAADPAGRPWWRFGR